MRARHLRRLYICILTIVLLAGPGPRAVLAQAPLNAVVDRTTVTLGEEVTLTVTLTGDLLDLPTPELPPLADFKIVSVSTSSQIILRNGELSSQIGFIYRLQPLHPGQLTIPSIAVQMDGQTFTTDPITIEVLPAGSGQEPGLPGDTGAEDFFVEAEVDNTTPYLGQQILYIFKFYQAVELIHRPDYQPPAFTNFWGQNVVSQPQYNTRLNNRNYLVTEIHTALFPASVGPITIEPARLVIPGGLFEPDITLETPPITVDVRPLPPNAPPGFNGAVGRFSIRASLDRTEGVVNEPVTLVLVIEGEGNIEVVTEPDFPDLPNWRIFDSQARTTIRMNGDAVAGERTFERLMVPGRPGEYTIPAISFSFFDPQSGEYRTIQTAPLPITIRPGEGMDSGDLPAPPGGQAVARLGDDIRHIKPVPAVLVNQNVSVLDRPWYWAGWAVPPLAVLGVWLWHRRRQRLLKDEALARRLGAKRKALKILAEAGRPGIDGYAAAQRSLLTYLSDRLNRPTTGLTRSALVQLLQEAGLSPELVEQVIQLLEQTDIGRFAPVDRSAADEVVRQARRLIDRLERETKKVFRLPPSSLILLLVVGLVWGATVQAQGPVTPEEAMAVANRAYESGDYGRAVETYELMVAAGIRNSAVFYNLGNAYFKQGDLGRAILNYRRAQLLSPRDPDIAANLALARRQTVDRLESSPQGTLTNLVEIAEERLTLQEAALLALVLWVLICGLVILLILFPRRKRLWLPVIGGLGFFLIAGLISNANRYYINSRYPPAVVVAPTVDVTSGPGGGDLYLVEFELHSGAEIRLMDSRSGWRRIIISDELQGWVPESAVEPVILPAAE